MRKLLSIILVLTLSICCINNVFSEPASSNNSGSFSSAQNEILKNIPMLNSVNTLSFEESNRINLVGKITSVMNYQNGQLVSIRHRNGTIDVYDSNGFRASIEGIDNVDGTTTFAYTCFQLYASDAKKIEAAGGLIKFLEAIGFTESQIASLLPTSEDATTDTSGIDTTMEWISTGVNASATIAISLFETQIVLSANGKQRKTINNSGELMSEWIYDKNGNIQEYIGYSYSFNPEPEIDETTGEPIYDKDGNPKFKTDNDGNVVGQYKLTKTSTQYDEKGLETKTYRIVTDTSTNEVLEELAIAEYGYRSDGSKKYEKNLETGDITYYTNNKASYVKNKEGSIITEYKYSPAGIISTRLDYKNGVQTGISIYDANGRFITSGTSEHEFDLRREVQDLLQIIRDPNSTAQDIELAIAESNILSLQLTPEDLNNWALVQVLFFSSTYGGTSEQLDRLKAIMKGYYSLDNLLTALAVLSAEEGGLPEGERYFTSIKRVLDSIKKQGGSFTVSISRGSESRETNREEGTPAVDSETGAQVTTVNYDQEEYSNLSFSITFLGDDHKSYVFENGRVIKLESSSHVTDKFYGYNTIIEGKMTGYVDAEGNAIDADRVESMIAEGKAVYIKMSADSINMLDGAGFKAISAGDGEEIYIKVGDLATFNIFKDSVGKGQSVMMTGVVTNALGGKMVMQLNGTSGIGNNGLVVGADNIRAAKYQITSDAGKTGSWVAKNTVTNRKIFEDSHVTAGNQNYLTDWKKGWNELARLFGSSRD
ncbi:MAG: hypothetical protein LBT18_03580 [Endomicrobium sp.]|nr:hypothetical protein [Endomicrobium sp.]